MNVRKIVISLIFVLLLLAGCSSSAIDFTVEKAPDYKAEQSFPMIIKATKNSEDVIGLDIVATLEMEKMDHGVLEVTFTDNGDGTYIGEVELPMAGEWIADIVAKQDGKTYEKILTFNVKEG